MRPTEIELTADHDLRPAPMPGANLPLDLVRLDSPPDRFSILGWFPAGFERTVPGGYAAAEEFLVLDGELELEGRVLRRGDLTVVPAGYPRTAMRSEHGCLILAWFGGMPDFRSHDELPPCEQPIATARVDGDDELPASPMATWAREALPAGDGPVEVVSAGLVRWIRATEPPTPGPGDLVRREHR